MNDNRKCLLCMLLPFHTLRLRQEEYERKMNELLARQADFLAIMAKKLEQSTEIIERNAR